jgi:hypothetical protein
MTNKKTKEDPERPQREVNFMLAAKVILVLSIIGTIITAALIFTPPLGGEGYAELAILTYNEGTGEYQSSNYPTNMTYNSTSGYSENVTIYYYLSNNFEVVKLFEIRLKIGLQNVLVNKNIPGNDSATYFYESQWQQLVMNSGDQIGPSAQTALTYNFSSTIISELGSIPEGYKIIFELWEWNGGTDSYRYTGIYNYISNVQLTIVS